MSGIGPRLKFFLRKAIAALRRSYGISLLSILTMGIALATSATFLVIVETLDRFMLKLSAEVEISAYLSAGIKKVDAAAARAEISAWPGIAEVTHTSSARALDELRVSLKDDAGLLDGFPSDALPAVLTVRLAPKSWSGDELRELAERIKEVSGIDDVRYGRESIERVGSLLGLVRIIGLVLGISLSLATILIISNTIRLTVYARRDEIEIMSLVGATDAFVRAPFIIEGVIQGVMGAVLAIVLLASLRGAITLAVERGLSGYGPIQLDLGLAHVFAYLLIAGALLGLVGSALAVGKFLEV